jgi:hypothetical protein
MKITHNNFSPTKVKELIHTLGDPDLVVDHLYRMEGMLLSLAFALLFCYI